MIGLTTNHGNYQPTYLCAWGRFTRKFRFRGCFLLWRGRDRLRLTFFRCLRSGYACPAIYRKCNTDISRCSSQKTMLGKVATAYFLTNSPNGTSSSSEESLMPVLAQERSLSLFNTQRQRQEINLDSHPCVAPNL